MDRLHRRHHTGSLAHHHRQGRCHRSIMIIDHASCVSPLCTVRSSKQLQVRTTYRVPYVRTTGRHLRFERFSYIEKATGSRERVSFQIWIRGIRLRRCSNN